MRTLLVKRPEANSLTGVADRMPVVLSLNSKASDGLAVGVVVEHMSIDAVVQQVMTVIHLPALRDTV